MDCNGGENILNQRGTSFPLNLNEIPIMQIMTCKVVYRWRDHLNLPGKTMSEFQGRNLETEHLRYVWDFMLNLVKVDVSFGMRDTTAERTWRDFFPSVRTSRNQNTK